LPVRRTLRAALDRSRLRQKLVGEACRVKVGRDNEWRVVTTSTYRSDGHLRIAKSCCTATDVSRRDFAEETCRLKPVTSPEKRAALAWQAERTSASAHEVLHFSICIRGGDDPADRRASSKGQAAPTCDQ
jgi:hypothetical protein